MTQPHFTRRDVLTFKAGTPVHIASLVVQVIPAHASKVRDLVATFPKAELHETAHTGKLAVVLECTDGRELSSCVEQLHALRGVLTVSIVSHLIDEADTLDEVSADGSESPGVS